MTRTLDLQICHMHARAVAVVGANSGKPGVA
jgi:hypothetical protein